MSLSPLESGIDAANPQRASYEAGWVAIHRMIREGASWSGRERNVAFLNTGDGRFAQVSAVSGLDFPDDGRAVASVDWDFDGDTDLWIANRTAPRVRLMLNDSPRGEGANGFVAFRLAGKLQRDAIGARVEVRIPGEPARVLVQSLRAGEGYLSQSSKVLTFGLGDAREIESVRVRWPSGDYEEFSGASARGWFTLTEGSGRATPWAVPSGQSKLAPGAPVLPAADSVATVSLAARVPLPKLLFTDLEGSTLTLEEPTAPYALLLWASWCAPCVVELRELAAAAREIDSSGLRIVAVCLDDPQDRPKAAALLADLKWPYAAIFAEGETIDALDTLQQALVERRRPLALPASFLVDQRGSIAAVRRGPTDAAQLIAMAAKLDATFEQLRNQAAPFSGRWVGELPKPPYGIIEARFRERGLDALADEFQRMTWKRIESSVGQLHYRMGIAREKQGRADLALSEFALAVSLEPEFLDARLALAYMLQRSGDHAGAIEAYGVALRKHPRHVVALENLIVSLAFVGKRELAQERLEQLRLVDAQAADRMQTRLSQKNR